MAASNRCVSLLSLVALFAMTSAADAKCTRLAFSVNDYGKEGPIKDAKALLDKYIAQWTAERGIKKYTTGKKDVSCELFLDVIVFDEHTCKASATVCWGDNQPIQAKAGDPPSVGGPVPKAAPATDPAAKPKAAATAPQASGGLTTGAVPKAPAPAKPATAPAASAPAAGAPALSPPPKAQ